MGRKEVRIQAGKVEKRRKEFSAGVPRPPPEMVRKTWAGVVKGQNETVF